MEEMKVIIDSAFAISANLRQFAAKVFLPSFRCLLLLSLALSFHFISGCGSNSEPSLPAVDYDKAKALGDGVAGDLVRNDVKDLEDKLDVGFHTIVGSPADLQKVMNKMYGLYGRPLQCNLKAAETGVRRDGSWKRASRTFFYAVKTTKYPFGKYFLKVEVVAAPNGGFLDVSGFGFFTFKDGTVPAYLQ